MMPSRSASPSVAIPISALLSSTTLRRADSVCRFGAGRRPPNSVSCRSWITSTSQRAVSRMVCSEVRDTPYIGSRITRSPRLRMASILTERMMESRYGLSGSTSSTRPSATACSYGTKGMSPSPSCAMITSSASVSVSSASRPPCINTLIPLYSAGLWLAVTARPYRMP